MNFTQILTDWYAQNKRELPWRNTKNPYFIWLSEIMLQQTRVAQGLPYYEKFVASFPTVEDLANADNSLIMKLWQGLGYYSRARNLHFTAQTIAHERNGNFPTNYRDLKDLKGVGDYTAAAIASFCFDEKVPVIDGNVYRVLSRIYGIDTPMDSSEGKKLFRALAEDLIKNANPATHNQAIMEFGALQCVPKSPSCTQCPFLDNCAAVRKDQVALLPVKAKKTKVEQIQFHYFVFEEEGKFYLKQRNEGIWQNLFDFPLIATNDALTEEFVELARSAYFTSKEYTHILTHKRITARFYCIKGAPGPNFTAQNATPHAKESVEKLALPRLIDKFWSDFHMENTSQTMIAFD